MQRELAGDTARRPSKPTGAIELRPHQRAAVAAIAVARAAGLPGFLLADDLGLGKNDRDPRFLAAANTGHDSDDDVPGARAARQSQTGDRSNHSMRHPDRQNLAWHGTQQRDEM